MRVLHVIPSLAERSGGPATAIIPMCRALMQQGIELLVLSTNDGLERIPNGAAIEYKGLPTIFFQTQFGASFKYSRAMSAWLSSNIHSFSLAHIHAVFNHSSVVTSQACRKARVPYIVRPLGTLDPWSMSQRSLRKRLFWQISGKNMLRHAAAVHYTSEAEKLSTERHLRLNHGRVVALGIDSESEHSTLAVAFPELASNPYVLVLSRLHPKKAVDVLIDAFLRLVQSDQFADWRLVIAGDGPSEYVSKLKAKVAASESRTRFVFTGWLEGEKKSAVLSGASLLALPSYQENFGLCVMEALAYSVPVLVSPNVDLAAEIATANAGWIAAIDKDALATTLAEALANKDELTRRGSAGKRLSQKYSWQNTARDLANLYHEVSNGSANLH
jgi:glycosyltransferase involved in cell wall biosynthesis